MEQIPNINTQNIKDKIYTIRGIQVMLDKDLAELYQVETKVFNQAVKRNIERFPENFRFQLTNDEYKNLRSQIVTSSLDDSLRSQFVTLESQRGKHTKYLPFVFTEQGVAMLSAVLRSNIAVQVSIQRIMDKKEVYHIGASLKDLCKRWFAFSKLDMDAFEILNKIENR